MLKPLLFGLALSAQAVVFCCPSVHAAPGDIGGAPVKAISPINDSYLASPAPQNSSGDIGGAPVRAIAPLPSYSTVYSQTYLQPSIIIISPVHYPYPFYSRPDCGSNFGVSIGRSFSLSTGTLLSCW
jgi:hypothetical protein